MPKQKRTKERKPSYRSDNAPNVPSLVCRDLVASTDTLRSPYLGTILLVDDNPDDVFMVGRALQALRIPNPVVVVRDGDQALQYLNGDGQYSDRQQFPIPSLILLDLNLPGKNGFQLLSWLRQRSDLRHLPVVVLTASTYSPDVRRAYQLGANSFLTKPTDFVELISELKAMSEFWLINQGAQSTPERGPAKLGLPS